MPTAKKKAAPTKRKPQNRTGRPVRLDLTEQDHKRVEAAAKKLGLSKASYARMVLLERLLADEAMK